MHPPSGVGEKGRQVHYGGRDLDIRGTCACNNLSKGRERHRQWLRKGLKVLRENTELNRVLPLSLLLGVVQEAG